MPATYFSRGRCKIDVKSKIKGLTYAISADIVQAKPFI